MRVATSVVLLVGLCGPLSSANLSLQAYEKQQQGKLQEAVDLYQAALRLDPGDWISAVNLASLAEASNPQIAVNLLLQAVRFKPTAATAYYNLGTIMAKQIPPPKETEWAYRTAIALHPTMEMAYSNLANHLQESKGDFGSEEVSQLLHTAIRLNPGGSMHYFNLASGLRRSARPEMALQLLQDSLRLQPSSRTILSDVVAVLKALNRHTDAEKVLADAVQRGIWSNPDQYPGTMVANLTGRAWHDVQDYRCAGHPLSKIVDHLESRWEPIRDEYVKNQAQIPLHYQADLARADSRTKWKGCKVAKASTTQLDPTAFDRHCVLPITRAAVDEAVRISGMQIVTAKFSVLQASAVIAPHVGPANNRLKLHLGLIVPEPQLAAITVQGEARGWVAGRINIFDDSFEHWVFHNGTQDRVILDLVVEHPDYKGRISHGKQCNPAPPQIKAEDESITTKVEL